MPGILEIAFTILTTKSRIICREDVVTLFINQLFVFMFFFIRKSFVNKSGLKLTSATEMGEGLLIPCSDKLSFQGCRLQN